MTDASPFAGPETAVLSEVEVQGGVRAFVARDAGRHEGGMLERGLAGHGCGSPRNTQNTRKEMAECDRLLINWRRAIG